MRRVRFAVALLFCVSLAAVACKRRAPPTAHRAEASSHMGEPVPPAPPIKAIKPDKASAPSAAVYADGGAPAGYQRASVLAVVSMRDGGNAVLLADAGGRTVLPIFIGGSEALSISLRLQGEHAERPLTHDLLSSLVAELGGKPIKVHVDELRGNTFIGSVFVEQNGRILHLDARPSDAIAFALGSGIPVFVATDVMATGGVSREELDRARDKTLDSKKKSDPVTL